MIFKDKLDEKTSIIRPEVDRLLEIAWKNQYHPGDLLLLKVNGFFDSDANTWNENPANPKFNPHSIGPGVEGHSENTHYKFIDIYRTTNISKYLYNDYITELVWSSENQHKIQQLIDIEEISVQIEMLIYIKFWEADLIIKKLYQFIRILHGEYYDWYFKIAESSRDKNCTGTRQDIIRCSIRNRIQKISPLLYQIIKDSYKPQIRNSIAHSNYSFLGRNISLNNLIKNDKFSQLHGISFDEWINLFHDTIILHNETIRINNLINDQYAKLATDNNNTVEILITERNGKQYPLSLEYRDQWKDWVYYRH